MMKIPFTLRLLSMVAILALATLSSCKDDDESPSNFITFDGNTKALSSVLFLYGTEANEGSNGVFYRHELDLLGTGLSSNSNGEVSGKGDAIVLDLNGATTGLDAGTYAFVDNEVALSAVWNGTHYADVDASGSGGGTQTEFTALTLKVAKSGDKYTIDLDGTAGGKAVKAHYEGTIITSTNE